MDVIQYDDCQMLKKYEPQVHIRTPENAMLYNDVLTKELEAKCILDIVQEGQIALSLRPYEAVCYNRKLLTNNRTILKFPFYNPQYMQFFEKVNDIDWNWVKEDIAVDYHYNGEFSPIRLLEDIKRRI
jgi:hypothetical protein